MSVTESSSAATSDEPPGKGLTGSPLTAKLSRLSLNPNAVEFVPSSSRSATSTSAAATITTDATTSTVDIKNKPNLDRTSSANSNASDDEYRQYWRSQLPDDLIDVADLFSDGNQYDQQASSDFDLALGSRSGPARTPSAHRNGEQLQPHRTNGSSTMIQDQHAALDRKQWVNGIDGVQLPEEINPLHLLAAEFPNFAVQSLTEVYFANNCDLALTIEMLTQLELQEEGAPSRRPVRPSTAAPSLTPMDFPSLPGMEAMNDNRSMNAQRPMDLASSVARRFGHGEQGVDFAAVVRKQAAQQPQWHHRAEVPMRQTLGGGYGYGSREVHRMPVQPQPWLETGEAVANMYTDMREEARDHARVRNAYFEQARQAYLIGNKALAKELSAKGQWHNEQMKMAHGKAAEAIFQQRNSPLLQLSRDGQSRMIDLHGLHVSEAIPLLKRELSALKMASRNTSKRQCIYVCVGTGHHTKGSRTPARVPIAIERYLAEEERLQFSEVQPGMLRVIV